MKKNLIFLLLFTILLSCSRDWDHPLEADSDLTETPEILSLNLNFQNEIEIKIGKDYSDDVNILLEKKTGNSAFQQVVDFEKNGAILIDKSQFNQELEQTFAYRFRIEKNNFYSQYSDEESIFYEANIIYAPITLQANTVELEGVRLTWIDKSQVETGFIIERNREGEGYIEIERLDANITNYTDTDFSVVPEIPIQLSYRVRAYKQGLKSDWVEVQTYYTGISEPTNLRIIDNTYYHFTLKWNDNSTKEVAYYVKKNDAVVKILESNSTTFTDKLKDLGTYVYTVEAKAIKDGQEFFSIPSNSITKNFDSFAPTKGLMLHYALDGNAKDSSVNGFDGTIFGSPTNAEDRFGDYGKAFYFDGNDYIDSEVTASDLGIYGSAPKAVSVWVYTQEFNKGGIFDVGKKDNGQEFCLRTVEKKDIFGNVENNWWQMQFWGGKDYDKEFQYVSYEKWTNFVLSYDGNFAKVYADGNFLTDKEIVLTTGNELTFRLASYGDRYFKGKIDDLYVYNRSLSPSEILELYHERGWKY